MKGRGHLLRNTTMKKNKTPSAPKTLPKSRTGIRGLDEITGGGLPAGRPTLVCGGAGCGKTLLAMEFLVRGATEYGEPGVFMAFEETGEELTENVASLGFDLQALVASKKLLARLRVRGSQRIRGDGRIRSRRSLHPARLRDRFHQGETRGARHDRGAFRRPAQSSHRARGTAPALSLAQGKRRHGHHDRRARRRHADALWPGGIRLRLRHLARSSRGRSSDDPPHPRRQISRHHARHERVSVPHREGRHLDLADHFRPARTHRLARAHPDRHRAARHHAGRQRILSRKQHSPLRHRRHGQDERSGDFCRCHLPAGRALPLHFLRGIPQPDHAQHGHDRARSAAVGEERDGSSFKPCGRFITGWKCTSPARSSSSPNSRRTW